jgi:hypothetical protein
MSGSLRARRKVPVVKAAEAAHRRRFAGGWLLVCPVLLCRPFLCTAGRIGLKLVSQRPHALMTASGHDGQPAHIMAKAPPT